MFRKLLTRAQSSKRQTGRSFNPQVAGSSPAGGTSALRALRTTAPATVGPSRGGNSCEPALTGPPPALARWAGKAGARSTDSRRVAKWKRQVGYPVTVVRLVAHQPISCLQNAARRAMVSEPNHPAGIVCNALENLQVRLAGRHRLAGRINPCASASSGLPGVAAAVCELCGHSPRCPPRFLSYSTRAPQKPPQKPPGIRAILEVLCELLVSLPHPRQR